MESSWSKFSSPNWSPDSETRLYEEVPGGYKLTVSGSNSGSSYSWGYTALYDGQDHPVHGRQDVDSIEPYRVNDRITLGLFKKNGQIMGAYARTLSTDGQSLKVVASGINDSGNPYFNVSDYKKP